MDILGEAYSMSMKIHPMTLAFSGSSRDLELPFLNHYALNNLRQVRIAILVAAIFYALFGLLDLILVSERVVLFLILRWAIVCPLMLALLRFTYTDYHVRFMHPALCLGTLIAGLGIVVMSVWAPLEHRYTYLAGMVQIQFFVYTVLRIRFLWASSIITILFGSYVGSTMASGNLAIEQLISDSFFLLGINLMGMLACYLIEYYARKNFYLSRQLETKKRGLNVANQLLEKRVEKRTAELTQTNQLLEIEIKERKATEKELRRSKIRYGRMVNNVTDFICVHDLDGRILEVNNRMVAGLGYPYLELTRKNLRDLIIPEQRSAFDLYLKRLHRREQMTGSVTLQTKDGLQRLLAFSNILVQDETDQDVVYNLARDITEHKRTVRALEESQARFKDIFETAAAGMMIINGQSNKIVEINSAAALMIGESALKIKGKEIDQLIHHTDDDPWLCYAASVDPVECLLVSTANCKLPVLKTMRPIEIDGSPHWILSFINIQKVKEAEEAKRNMELQLNRAQHLQAIGTLAGGIAHDFNNILYGSHLRAFFYHQITRRGNRYGAFRCDGDCDVP